MAPFKRQFLVQYAKTDDDGNTHWPYLGRAFEDKNRITVKLDSLPVGDWDGRLMLYPIKEIRDGE